MGSFCPSSAKYISSRLRSWLASTRTMLASRRVEVGMNSYFLRAFYVAFALLLATLPSSTKLLYGQATDLGTILGNVTDPQNAAVPAATVKVTNMGTGVSRELTTDSQGGFAV